MDNEKNQRIGRIISYVTIILPFLVTIFAIFFMPPRTIDLILFGVMYVLTVFGITIGFHRYFTHHSFECKPWVRDALIILGSMAAQGPLLYWVASHRRHHRYADQPGDPHSPNEGTKNWIVKFRSFWHAHIGWMLKYQPEDYGRYAIDLLKSKKIVNLSNKYIYWILLGLVVPGIIAGLYTHSLYGIMSGIVWGGFVRIFVVHHVTWSINSICHLFGKATYANQDKSTDNLLLGILALGEGWHNSHHAFPTSARHGLLWWQLDFSYLTIFILSKVGLVWNIKQPKISNIKPI